MEHSAHEIYEMHAIVKGNVQGVGFRAMTRDYAQEMQLKGLVRNLPDGTVEIYAQGSKPYLEELLARLRDEFSPGEIREATIEYFPVETHYEDFRIIH